MLSYFLESELRVKFKQRSIIIGSLFVLFGFISILVPSLTSFTLSVLLGLIFLVSGSISAYLVFNSYNKNRVAWFKPVFFLIIGILILRHPIAGVGAIGLILMIYFFFDGFASIFLALEFRPINGWWWLFFNGVVSIIIALVFLFGWPISSIWLIGFLVGISLLSTGFALIMLGISLPKYIF